jgi:uncharacterized membrane protein
MVFGSQPEGVELLAVLLMLLAVILFVYWVHREPTAE